ncbi:uncharacterized protein LOC121050800 [Rosa chinensis]|uniref:uncharacterized protein LOC121050800 n=1 Tax=Rosa chinensis TaxID=74649 RepID=UPI001AD8AE48|nr:uncharacterized protein LOC121050800 [Rosa chinensis]
MMIPYLRGCLMYAKGIMIFLKRVREHIDRCSTLNNLETVEAALESSIFREEYEDWKKEKTSTSRMEDMADAKDQVNHQGGVNFDDFQQLFLVLSKNCAWT